MAEAEQKQTHTEPLFDLVERNLPKQETDDEGGSLSVLEFVFWMLGISAALFLLQYLSHLLF
jgi:hypothetical protein